MSEYTPPPPPPAQPVAPPPAPAPEKKKGLSTMAWVGIGCGALLLIALIVFAAGSWFVANKVREVAGDFENNPAMAAAVMAVRLNPELELVDSDQDAGTLTVRNVKTGEEVTVDLQDVEQGRLSVLTGDGEESSIQIGQGEGGFEVTTEQDGKTSRLRFGAGNEDVPGWLPVYPGSEPSGTYVATTQDTVSGTFALTTSDASEEVLDWYAGELEGMGLTVERTTFSTDVNRGGSIRGHEEGREVSVTVITQDQSTQIQIIFNGPQQ